MANTNINIRMDADLKRQFEAFCACLLYTSIRIGAIRTEGSKAAERPRRGFMNGGSSTRRGARPTVIAQLLGRGHPHRYMPVSYTHLDVYKRQVICPFSKRTAGGGQSHHLRIVCLLYTSRCV